MNQKNQQSEVFVVCTFSIAWCDIGGYEDVKRLLRGSSTSRILK